MAEERAFNSEYEAKMLLKEGEEAAEELKIARERVRRLEGKLKEGKEKYQKAC